jgi:hypothetical protein
MIRTSDERWNVEYLSGMTYEVVELVSEASILALTQKSRKSGTYRRFRKFGFSNGQLMLST